MSEAQVDTRERIAPRSMVRVKAASLAALFLACWVTLKLWPNWHDNALFAVAALSAVLFYFIRCETCHSSIYYRRGGRRAFPAGLGAFALLTKKRCPECGMDRI
jgi:hypothetical protein